MFDWLQDIWEVLVSLYYTLGRFAAWVMGYLQNAFDPTGWVLFLLDLLPRQSADIAAMFSSVASFLDGAMPALVALNVLCNLPALAAVVSAILALEVGLAVIWLWRGVLSIIPLA